MWDGHAAVVAASAAGTHVRWVDAAAGGAGVHVCCGGEGPRDAHADALVFVQGEGVDVAAVGGGGLGAEVDYPDCLKSNG